MKRHDIKKLKLSKFLKTVSWGVIGLFLISDVALNSEIFFERDTASSVDIQRNLENYNLMKNKILEHLSDETLEPYKLKIVTKIKKDNSVILELFNFKNDVLLGVSNIIGIASSSFKDDVSKYVENRRARVSDKMSGEVSNYYYNANSKSSTVILSADGPTIDNVAKNVFNGDKKLAMDFVAFHEYTHYVSYHLADKIISEHKAQNVIDRLMILNIGNNISETIEINKVLLKDMYLENVADIMSLQLLEQKYPNLNIEKIAKNLSFLRNDDSQKFKSVLHLTSIGLLKLKKNSTGNALSYKAMYENADKLALESLSSIVMYGREGVNSIINKEKENNINVGFYKEKYNNENFLNMSISYKNILSNISLNKPITTVKNKY